MKEKPLSLHPYDGVNLLMIICELLTFYLTPIIV